ncbi:MAG: ChaN family lipoprotein, partial [Bacteroidota bacterium]
MKCNQTLCFLCLTFFFLSPLQAQQKKAYQWYNKKGRPVSYQKVVKKLSKADVVLFGELHNNPICHWLQLELSQDLANRRALILGAEMFERDNQTILSQYLNKEIERNEFKDSVRLWPNFATDYEPILAFAQERQIPFWATNIPRHYASLVYYDGFDTLQNLSLQEKEWMAPLPIPYDPELPGYKEMLDMIPGHGGENFPKAQAIKDATMAHSILEYYKENHLFFHLHGTYHSQNFEGILWYLQQEKPALQYLT